MKKGKTVDQVLAGALDDLQERVAAIGGGCQILISTDGIAFDDDDGSILVTDGTGAQIISTLKSKE